MVNTVNNDALKTLLGAQNASSQNSLAALKNNPKAKQEIVSQFQSTKNAAPSGAASMNMAPNASQLTTANNNPPPSNLPRGSLIDILA